jgi:glycosyltransferase involved in cell wall biosynthesis
MDYTINEVAAISKPQRPFLLLLGNIDEASQEIIALAQEKLDADDYSIRSVPYEAVCSYYKAADVFVLSSVKEGFGRVYLEALMYNLPVIAHHHPVMRYVIGEAGILSDLTKPGNLCAILQKLLYNVSVAPTGRTYVRQNFDWRVLAPQYRNMFAKARELN